MNNQGRFIVVEGLEGAGKSTAIQTIKQTIESLCACDVILTREPGGTRVGEVVRQLVKEKVDNETLDYRTELLLMYAARVQLVEQVIRPALANGNWVIADRFELSTYAYQGGGRGIEKKIIDDLSSLCLANFKPDLILFLDIPPLQGLQRAKLRSDTDRFEQEDIYFFEKINTAYHSMIKTLDNVKIIDASQALSDVQQDIIHQLKQYIASC